MTPRNIALGLVIIQTFIIVFYDNFLFFQKYPKVYEDALGCLYVCVFLILWQLERMNKNG